MNNHDDNMNKHTNYLNDKDNYNSKGTFPENTLDDKKNCSYQKNFVSVFYFTIYVNKNTPLLLCLLIERGYIFCTYIIITFENMKKKSMETQNGGGKYEEDMNSTFKKNNSFIIPLIHKKYFLSSHIHLYFDSLKDVIDNNSNMFINLYNILKVNFYCPLFSDGFDFSTHIMMNGKIQLQLSDIFYEIYKISHFYCSIQILEFYKGCINQYNSYNYKKKKIQLYKLYKNNNIEYTPSCYNYTLNDNDGILHLDIQLYDMDLTDSIIYTYFKKRKKNASIFINEKNKNKIILKFILNNLNGNIQVFMWPFSYFSNKKKKKKKNIIFKNILSYYEYVICFFMKKKIKNILS
ncbi:hypothetical protein PFTANZ_01759 [Plasmodium falciparum Tanzania (2000708)]|uniref:Uncharacterized protein n=1 Tax=Plasmodium falciparum Tanzania (2000708) TaxID=1036725 RepID=A0A024WAG7_PLAFA|nr:hypothetical protein PFTANZ_01759 [Plasmodium falciparum Tanzania (2000708)]